MVKRKNLKKGESEESLITSVAKNVGSVLGTIAGKTEKLMEDRQGPPAKKSTANRVPISQTTQKTRALTQKKHKSAKQKRKSGRRAKV